MALTDLVSGFFGRRKVAPTEVAGSPGFAVYGGYLQTNEKNVKLADTGQRYTIFSDLLANISIISAGVRFYLDLVGKASWKVEPADDSELAKTIAEHVEKTMKGMATPWPRVVRRAAMYKFYGFSIQEWIAKKNKDGTHGMTDVSPRPQHTIERWDIDPVNGEVLGVGQRAPQSDTELYIPRSKMVYVVDDSLSDSPEGLGMLRNLVEPALRLRRFQELEAFGYETDLRGIPVGKAPIAELNKMVTATTITQAQAEAMLTPLATFLQNHIKNPQLGILLDSSPYQSEDERGTPINMPQWSVELLNHGGQAPMEAVAKAIDRINRELARIMGVEHLLLGGDGKGSMALSKDKSLTFGLIVDSALTQLEHTFKSDFARVIVMLNGWDEELTPTLKTEQVQYRSPEEVSAVLVDMATAGAPLTPGDPAIDEMRDLLGLSRVPPEIMDALIEAAMLGAQERSRLAAGGAKPGEQTEEEETPPAPGEEE